MDPEPITPTIMGASSGGERRWGEDEHGKSFSHFEGGNSRESGLSTLQIGGLGRERSETGEIEENLKGVEDGEYLLKVAERTKRNFFYELINSKFRRKRMSVELHIKQID